MAYGFYVGRTKSGVPSYRHCSSHESETNSGMSERSESLSDVLAALGKKSGITPGFRDGGLIRGPGTGISDSIPRDIRKGSFILPADSTRFFGVQALAKLGRRPRGLSHEDFGLTPEAVFHMGWKVLNAMRVLTHTPAAVQQLRRGRRGFEGGTEVDPLASHNVVREGNSYSGDNVAGNVTINNAPAGGTFSSVPGSAHASEPASSGDEDTSSGAGGTYGSDLPARHNVVRQGNSYSGDNISGNVSINDSPAHGTFSVVPAQRPSSPAPAGNRMTSSGTQQSGASDLQGSGWGAAIPNPATQGQALNSFMKPVRLPNGSMGYTVAQMSAVAGQSGGGSSGSARKNSAGTPNPATQTGNGLGASGAQPSATDDLQGSGWEHAIPNPATQGQAFGSFLKPVRLPNGSQGYTASQMKLAASQAGQ